MSGRGIRDAVTNTEHARRKTVTAMDVVYALNSDPVSLAYNNSRIRMIIVICSNVM
ncbi:hypothetical protein ACLB2K_076252 [Fragaria x ananassa]